MTKIINSKQSGPKCDILEGWAVHVWLLRTYQYFCFAQQGSGQTNELSLTNGQIFSSLVNLVIEAVSREIGHKSYKERKMQYYSKGMSGAADSQVDRVGDGQIPTQCLSIRVGTRERLTEVIFKSIKPYDF